MASFRAQRSLITIVGIAASAVFIYLAVRHLDFGSVMGSLKTAKVFPWVPIAVLFYLTGHVVRGHRCRLLLQRESSLSLVTASNVVVVGYASNNVLPARLGEFVRAGMLVERTGIPIAQALTVTFVERLLDGIAILLLLIVSSAVMHVEGWVLSLTHVATLIFGVASIVVLIAVVLPNFLLSLTLRLTSPLPPRWRDRAVRLTTSITNGGACLRRPKDAVKVILLSFVVWALESCMFIALLPAFSIPLHFSSGVIAMSVTNLGILVPSTPGFVGPFHFFCSKALVSLGVTEAVALSYAVLVHLSFYVPVTIWGAIAVLWYGVEVGSSAALARTAAAGTATTSLRGLNAHVIGRVEPRATPGEPSEFHVALAQAVVPDLDAPRDEVRALHASVARFLAGQIDALPARVRSLFHIGMSVFRFWVRVRYFGSFCGLRPDVRRRAVQGWAFGRFALFRQLFRPVRSIALLAYYEHPLVLERLDAKDPPAAPRLKVVHGV